MVETSPRTYRKGVDIIQHGDEDLKAKLRRGDISLDAAYRKIEKPAKMKRSKSGTPSAETSAVPATTPEVPAEFLVLGPEEAEIGEEKFSGEYEVIVANIPWEATHISFQDIQEIIVPYWATQNSILWVRATNERIEDAFSLARHWGFTPKTLFTWRKPEREPGELLDSETEHYVVATAGNPAINYDASRLSTFLNASLKPGTGKPVGFYQMIEGAFLGKKRMEIGAEAKRDGWDVGLFSGTQFSENLKSEPKMDSKEPAKKKRTRNKIETSQKKPESMGSKVTPTSEDAARGVAESTPSASEDGPDSASG